MSTVQANFLLPEEVLATLRALVPKGKQSQVVAHALKNELRRIQYKQALEHSFGAWETANHPELKKGTEAFIRRQRSSSRSRRTQS
jgi:hypothetical protein